MGFGHWNNRFYTWVLMLSLMVFVMRGIEAPVTAAMAQSATIAFSN